MQLLVENPPLLRHALALFIASLGAYHLEDWHTGNVASVKVADLRTSCEDFRGLVELRTKEIGP